MSKSGNQAKDRDLGFGVHRSKISFMSVWSEKKGLKKTHFLNYKRIPSYRAEV